MKHYFEEIETILSSQQTTRHGLSTSQAAQRLEEFGKNRLKEAKKKSIVSKLMAQMTDPMILILIAAGIVSGVVGEIADTIIIMTVVVLNSILGVVQEGKAEKAIEALQKLSSPFSKVKRNGQVIQIKSEELVPGDVVIIEAGDAIPADMRLIESSSLKIEEASLTGESVPSEKDHHTITAFDDDLPLGDRHNMAYMGTNVVYGRGEAVVIATGMATEMGKIANIIANAADEKTPLQNKLADLSRVLSIGVIGICIFIFVFGVVENGGFAKADVLGMFLTAISLAVAAIPEGLVAVVTIVLSIGVTKMSKRNSIVRRLTAVETLGCTQVICSDKTGTLTQNKMKVVDTFGDKIQLATAMTLCNDAYPSPDNIDNIIGEPTESALVRFAFDLGINKLDYEQKLPRVAEAPFDSVRKMMSTIHQKSENSYIQYTKGAPDELLNKCTTMLTENGVVELTDQLRRSIINENRAMAGKALRVLGAAMKKMNKVPDVVSPETLEKDLIFIGLAGMIDPVRPEVKAAIEECNRAGIKTIMITGDHRDTAVAIAKELNIIQDEKEALTGAELSRLTDEEFTNTVKNYAVYARVQPEHKVRIVTTWKKHNKITAMTGDGVNDAPALKSADIGIGMGITGTDVTKNVSDMVLADDNFASIVHAVEEGRKIYDNIRKTIQFLLSSNLCEVIVLFIATILNIRLFLPIHLLWINLVTDSLPAIALGMEGAEHDIMDKQPRGAKEGVFSNGVGVSIIYQGIVLSILTLASYFIGASRQTLFNTPFDIGMTMAFVTLCMGEIFHSLNMRSRMHSIFKLKKSNFYLLGAMVITALLTYLVVYMPGLNDAFRLFALDMEDFLIATGLAFAMIPIVEIVKLFQRLIKK